MIENKLYGMYFDARFSKMYEVFNAGLLFWAYHGVVLYYLYTTHNLVSLVRIWYELVRLDLLWSVNKNEHYPRRFIQELSK